MKKCPYCHERFKPRKQNQKFCSAECRQRYYRGRQVKSERLGFQSRRIF